MTKAEKITRAKADYDEVYEAGEKAENGRMWDYIQNYGDRSSTELMFMAWNCKYIRPKHKIVATNVSSRRQTFLSNRSLKIIEKKYFDFTQCPKSQYPTSNLEGWYYTFTSCFDLEVIEDIGLCNANIFTHTFNWCGKLHTIECIYPDKDTKFNKAFDNCGALTYIRVNGVIGQNIDFKDCPLDVESALSVMRALRNFQMDVVYADAYDIDGFVYTQTYLDEDGDGNGDILIENPTGNVCYTFPTIYFSEATLALLDSTDFSTYPEEELPFYHLDGWRCYVETKRWNIG